MGPKGPFCGYWIMIGRLLSGNVIVTINKKRVFIRPFSVDDKALAEIIGQEVYEDCVLEGVLTQEDISDLLLAKGWWSEELEGELKGRTTKVEDMKVDYYRNFFSDARREFIKKHLEREIQESLSLLEKKSYLFDKTCEYVRDYSKVVFLIERSSYIDNTEPIDESVNILNLAIKYTGNQLTDSEIRGIAKSAEWRNLWGCSKSTRDLFGRSVSELTSEQVSLVSWSRFYDNINESMDRPNDKVIQDDFALDGWAIEQSRKREEEQKKQDAEKLMPKNMGNAGEVFLPFKNEKEKEDILSLNDGYGKAVLKSKYKDLKKHGSRKESELSHVRQEIQMEANKARR